MQLLQILGLLFLISITLISCTQPDEAVTEEVGIAPDFTYETEQFADLRVLRYPVPGFEDLSLKQKQLVFYLYQAGLSGRDIIWDQNYQHNLRIRRTLENIVRTYEGDRSTEEWNAFMVYTKRVWFSNGIHHHYSNLKIDPGFSYELFQKLIEASDQSGFPLVGDESIDDMLAILRPVIFDPEIDSKKVNLDSSTDQVKVSATNFYEGALTQEEVEEFYAGMIKKDDPTPISYGLNSKVAIDGKEVSEQPWRVGGMYSDAIEQIVYWLGQATEVAESDTQRAALEKLIQYYQTGDLILFDEFNQLWVKETSSSVDFINGFIEVYNDPLGYKGSYESVVWFRDEEATKRVNALSQHAQWFEDNSPLLEPHKKENVKGITANVITVVGESGDASPSTPIGINLPNANWIRAQHGSKSVTLGNIVHAYEESSKSGGVLEEFAFSQDEIERSKKHSSLADNLHTDLHEVVGHASGVLEAGVGTPKETLKSYASTLEEARADLFALYFLLDDKLEEIGLISSKDVGKAAYDRYIRNGLLVQLARLKSGEDLEEAHMRNRQLIAAWTFAQGQSENVIEEKVSQGKTYFVVNDYDRLRELFGNLLREIQRIKSQGDYEAGKALVEDYGVKVDREVHEEVLERYAKLNRAPYAGFINPLLVAAKDNNGNIVDVKIEYPMDFSEQMLYYAVNYSFLPTVN